MSDELVSAAPPSGGISWETYKGALLLIEPLSWEVGIQTSYGTSDATKANVYIITGPGEAEEYLETLIFPKLLASQTKAQVGKKVVGRLGQGQAKSGQSAPWILEQATPDDLAKAQQFLASQKGPEVTGAQPPF